MVNKHMKKSSTSLTIKERQLKRTLRFHLTPVKMAVIKSTTKKKLAGLEAGWGEERAIEGINLIKV
jgi:hypothetical protein